LRGVLALRRIPRSGYPARPAKRRYTLIRWSRPRSLRALAGASSLALALLWTACGAAGAAPAPISTFGVNANVLRPGASTDAARRASADQIRAAGLDAVRLDVLWNDAQPVAGAPLGLGAYDVVVADLARRGLRIDPVLAYSAVWASSLSAPVPAQTRIKAPPAVPEAYASFASRVVRRYGRRGGFWAANPDVPYTPMTTFEVWNEPNSVPSWHPGPDPAGYAALLRATATAIHAADAQATVVVGGLVTQDSRPGTIDGPAFLGAMVAADPDIGRSFDAVGLHAYGSTAATTVDNVVELRAAMRRLGLGQPIALTEWGAPTSGAGAITEAARAALLSTTTTLLAGSDCGLLSIVPYAWQTDRVDPADREDWFGIAGTAGADAYRTAVAAARAGVPASGLCAKKIGARKQAAKPRRRTAAAR
jgi:hypothetical protein